jgi:hypothetical protein
MAFAVEEVPDPANLFRNVPAVQYDAENSRASSAAFNDPEMSVNWDKYATPEQHARPNTECVVAINCGVCRATGQMVQHAPVEPGQQFGPNQAHTEIRGKKTGSVKNKLRDSAQIVWRRPPFLP